MTFIRIILALFFLFAGRAATAQRFETLEDFSFAQDHANYNEKTNFFVTGDSVLVDGNIKSFPPDQITYDRTLVNILRIGFTQRFTPRFAARFILDSRYFIHKVFDENEPRNLENSEYIEGRPALDIVYRLPSGLDVFGGVEYHYYAPYVATNESVSFESETEYGEVSAMAPRGGIMKQGSSFNGGIYYMKGFENERSVTKEASDGSLIETDELVYLPTEVGLFVRVNIKGYRTDLEFAAVQAGQGGPTAGDEETETKMLEDYTRAKLGVFVPWERNNLNFNFLIAHKTLSYSDSDFMSMETLPMTTLHFKVINGSEDKHLYYGFVYGYTKDTQSAEEFNQRYLVNQYGAKLGAVYSF